MSWFNVHNHTENSNLRLVDCNIKLDNLIEAAIKKGLKGIAITDHECLSSHIKAIKKQKEINKNNIDFKIALGNEIYLVDSLEEVRDQYKSGITKFPHFILIAKNKQGYEAIRLLSSFAWENSFKTGFMERCVTTTQYLSDVLLDERYKGSVIGSTACLGGYIAIEYKNYINTNNNKHLDNINKFINGCKYLFEKDFYLEIQPSFNEEQINYNSFLIELSKQENIKLICSTDTHYLTKEHRKLHKSFLSSKEGDREIDDFYASTYLMDEKELWEYFKDYISYDLFKEILNNTLEIMNKINFFDMEHITVVPQIQIPPFNTKNKLGDFSKDKYEFINNMYTSEHLIDRYLIHQLDIGFSKKKQEWSEENLSRIDIELKQLWLISKKINSRLSSYYLLVQEIVDLMWTVSLVGIARGSATGYYICYLLDITQMNPIPFGLPYWRHLTAERPELPD